ncbi:MAG: hypothetical protein AAF674_17795 [Pseudomonadota bacterium]
MLKAPSWLVAYVAPMVRATLATGAARLRRAGWPDTASLAGQTSLTPRTELHGLGLPSRSVAAGGLHRVDGIPKLYPTNP